MTLQKLNYSTEQTFPLVEAGRAASIYVDDGEYEVVKIAAGDLAADIERGRAAFLLPMPRISLRRL